MNAAAERADIASLKAKVDLVGIVGGHVKLAKKGRAHWGCCPFHDERTPSFKIDPEQQLFHCFGCHAHGDVLDFVRRFERLDLTDAIDRLREIAGTVRKAQPKPRAEAPREQQSQVERNGELAREIWPESRTIADGAAFDYLTKRRGITAWDCDRVRWHPACPWGRERVGCIVCPVVSHATGYTVGVWRIRPVMAGPVERMGLGPTKHNFSPTWWTDGDELALTEGVEDALAFHQLTGVPTWSTLSADFMADVILPDRFRRVLIVQDNDPLDAKGRRPGPEAAQALARRLRFERREVRILASDFGKDPNDVLRKAVQ